MEKLRVFLDLLCVSGWVTESFENPKQNKKSQIKKFGFAKRNENNFSHA